eukprot:COSAG06_NODE_3657_length_5063_cov_2.077760_4_plen_74_part_00
MLDQDPPCVPEGFPYPANHTCYKFVPVGHYRCECVMDYEVSPTGGKLKNGYEVSHASCLLLALLPACLPACLL